MNIGDYLENYFLLSLSSEMKQKFNDETKIVHFKKGDTILREGDQAIHLYLILQGIVRGYYIDEEGNDITKCFASEGGFFSVEGFHTNGSATFTIECLENCESIQLPYQLLNEVIDHDLVVSKRVMQLFQQEMQNQEEKNRELILLNAEERYQSFCQTFPQLMNRVPLRCIASYIGIHFGSLSRIRNKVKDLT